MERDRQAALARISNNESQSLNAPVSLDTGGQTGDPGGLNPDPNKRGPEQEQALRSLLAREYEQKYGETDSAIRTNLGIRGKVADFLGYNGKSNRWLIAESKGGDIDSAYKQLSNTMKGLLGKESGSAGNIDLRIYSNANQFSKLTGTDGLGGWRVNSEGLLGWLDEYNRWNYAEIQGVRVTVQSAP